MGTQLYDDTSKGQAKYLQEEKNSEDTSPSYKIQFILSSDATHNSQQIRPIFSELQELIVNGNDVEWRETARWIKFKEDVEEGGNRWSKPHVATLSLHSLIDLKKCFQQGSVILQMKARSIEQIVELVTDSMVENNVLSVECKGKVRDVLLKKHIHQHQIGYDRLYSKNVTQCIGCLHSPSTHRESVNLDSLVPRINSSHASIAESRKISVKSTNSEILCRNDETKELSDLQLNKAFMRKVPDGAEACNILVGEVSCLESKVSAFIKLETSTLLGDLTEVPVPTRFIFILLSPPYASTDCKEIGRAMGTLMSDEIFREVAYKALNSVHLIAAVDEFLDAVTVLPPGGWDSSIRIEPPSINISQESRKKLPDEFLAEVDEEEEQQKIREETGLARTGILFGGLYNDIKRRAPFYLSDFKDGLSMQCVASWIFLYFACLSPIITFGGLLSEVTGKNMAAMESLISGFVCGVIYGLFSGQPLAILGSTGPVLIFETIVYNFCEPRGWDYMSLRFWIGTWMAIILLIIVATDASAFVCYITRFTEESFAILISLIFIYKAFQNVWSIGERFPVNPDLYSNCSCNYNTSILLNSSTVNNTLCSGTLSAGCFPLPKVSGVFLMSILLFIGTFIISIKLKDFKTATFFPSKVRQYISDFAVLIAILTMSVLDCYVGMPTPKLEVPHEFKPTLPGRGWVIAPFNNNPFYTVFVAIPPAILGTILLFMDQQITVVIVNRKEFKLKKGSGYHLDLFVLSILIEICSVMGLPWFVAATVLSLTHVNSLKVETECTAPGDKPQFLGVREQRVTHILIFLSIGLSVFLTPMLAHIPMPVLFGVFLYMGISSLKGLQFFDRIMIMFMPSKYQPDYIYLRQVPVLKVHIFTVIQLICLIILWMMATFTQTSMLFPLMLVVLVGVRKSLDRLFSQRELKILDDLMPKPSKSRYVEEKGTWCNLRRIILGPKLIQQKDYMKCNQDVKEP